MKFFRFATQTLRFLVLRGSLRIARSKELRDLVPMNVTWELV